jgi:hypothetical protein
MIGSLKLPGQNCAKAECMIKKKGRISNFMQAKKLKRF